MRIIVSIAVAIVFTNLSGMAQDQSSDQGQFIPMSKEHWEFPPGTVVFENHKSVPALKILPDAGKVVAKDIQFETGTVEYDVMIGEFPFVGFSFHRANPQEEEWFYFRTYAVDNPEAMDAIQYTPTIHGIDLWDMYPQYQAPATFKKNDWNHVKLVIGEHQMYVYVNEKDTPTLVVPSLRGNFESGAIAFNGEGIFANLRIDPGNVEGLPQSEGFDPSAHDPRYIRQWMALPPRSFPEGREVIASDMPDSTTQWSTINAERGALVNLTRQFAPQKDGTRQLVWLKTTVNSSQDQVRKLNLGFSDEVWVYINGQLLYVDKNYYYIPIMKKPEGRCSVENTSFEVPLQEGSNEILIGVGNSFVGWGIIAQFDMLENLSLNSQN